MKHTYESTTLAKRFERARNALLSWKDFDDGTEFAVRDLCMIDQRDGSGVACVIEYAGHDKPEGRVGFIAVASKYAPMFVGTHIIVKSIPPDGNWVEHHPVNCATYRTLIKSVFDADREEDVRCQEIMAVRRQILLYNLIFPKAIDISISDQERLMVSQAVILNKKSSHIDSLREYITRVDNGHSS